VFLLPRLIIGGIEAYQIIKFYGRKWKTGRAEKAKRTAEQSASIEAINLNYSNEQSLESSFNLKMNEKTIKNESPFSDNPTLVSQKLTNNNLLKIINKKEKISKNSELGNKLSFDNKINENESILFEGSLLQDANTKDLMVPEESTKLPILVPVKTKESFMAKLKDKLSGFLQSEEPKKKGRNIDNLLAQKNSSEPFRKRLEKPRKFNKLLKGE